MAKDDTKRTVLDRVQEAMRGVGLDDTQANIAKTFKPLSQPSVNLWGKSGHPEMKKAVQIALRTGVCVEWLLTGRRPRRPGDIDDPLFARLVAAWAKLSDETKQRVVGYALVSLGGDDGAPDEKKVPKPAG